MKTTTILLVLFMAASLAVADEAGCGDCAGCPGQERTCGNETVAVPEGGLDGVAKVLDARKVAKLSRTGPYDEAGKALAELMAWTGKHGVIIVGPPFGVYHDEPETVAPESARYDVCVTVSESAEPAGDGEVTVEEWGPEPVVSYLYRGPYSGLGPVYAGLTDWACENGYVPVGPGIEFYLSMPGAVPDDSLLTEVCLAVKEKEAE